MAKVRNWILNNCGCKYLVMIDDDVRCLSYFEESKKRKLEEYMDFIEKGFDLAEDIGVKLWGINLVADKNAYREYTPISMLSPILGPFSCILTEGNSIRYDEKLGLNEDYDYFLQVIRIDRKVLRFNKYHYDAEHVTKTGGCGAWRTIAEEKRQAEIMIKKWGERIVKYDFDKGDIFPSVNVPIRGI